MTGLGFLGQQSCNMSITSNVISQLGADWFLVGVREHAVILCLITHWRNHSAVLHFTMCASRELLGTLMAYVHSCQQGTRPFSPDQWLQRCSQQLQWSSQPLQRHTNIMYTQTHTSIKHTNKQTHTLTHSLTLSLQIQQTD